LAATYGHYKSGVFRPQRGRMFTEH